MAARGGEGDLGGVGDRNGRFADVLGGDLNQKFCIVDRAEAIELSCLKISNHSREFLAGNSALIGTHILI